MKSNSKAFVAYKVSPAERAAALAAFDARMAARPLTPPSRCVTTLESDRARPVTAAQLDAAKAARQLGCGDAAARCSPKTKCRPARRKDS